VASLPASTRRRSGGLVSLDDTTTALIYTRVSDDEQEEDGVSLPAQLGEIRRYIGGKADLDWIAGDEFQDVLSGQKDSRRDYQRLLLTVRGLILERRRVVVVVAMLDRLGRRVLERRICPAICWPSSSSRLTWSGLP
jgi:DNA invertase Pin-like site-specific DNA recombinase